MLSNFCNLVNQNKNLLMLITAGIYILALYATFSEKLLLISGILFTIFIYILYKSYLPIKYVVIWVILFYLGVINTTFRLRDVDDLLNLAPLNSEISGTIISIPQKTSDEKVKFFFKVDKIKFESEEKTFKDEKVLVTLEQNSSNNDLKLYNTASMSGRLSVPFKAGNPSQFDYGIYLRNHNTYAVFYAKTFTRIGRELSLKSKLLQKINDYRERILSIHAKYLPTPNLEILGGIVFGDDAVSPPKEIKQSFVNSGLLHILAASGMNVAFIYTFFFWIFTKLRINFKLSVVLGMLTVITYSLMTGLGAPVVRATIMLLFVLLGKLIDRDAHSISLLSFVGLLMLIFNPLLINDVGFQLSFIVTFGILLMAPAFTNFENKLVVHLVSSLSVPIIAQLWVIPIQIFYFNNISLYAVFANIMSIPLLALLSFGGFISSLLAIIPHIADFVCRAFDFVLNPMLTSLINISDFWGYMPNSAMQTTHPCMFQILIYYGVLLCLSGLLYKDFRVKHGKKLLITCLFLISILLISLVPIKNKNLEIVVFDVGNADCFLVKTPRNDYVVIDTGKAGYKGGKSQAEIILLKYLKDKGIKNIEALIITHFDNDHCGGAVDIINAVNVNRIFVNDLNHKSISADNIYKASLNKKSNIVLAENNQIVYQKDELNLVNLLGESSDSDNENSIITLLKYRDFTMLFTGDAGVKGIKSLLKELPTNITVLKVPHHGAIGGLDKDVAKYLNPVYSILSVGENKFGHPAPYTLHLLKNSKVLRTDIYNSIMIRLNKNQMKIFYYDLRKRKYSILK